MCIIEQRIRKTIKEKECEKREREKKKRNGTEIKDVAEAVVVAFSVAEDHERIWVDVRMRLNDAYYDDAHVCIHRNKHVCLPVLDLRPLGHILLHFQNQKQNLNLNQMKMKTILNLHQIHVSYGRYNKLYIHTSQQQTIKET